MKRINALLCFVFGLSGLILFAFGSAAKADKIDAKDIVSRKVKTPWGDMSEVCIANKLFARVAGQNGNPSEKRAEVIVERLRELLTHREHLKRSDICPLPVGDGGWVVGVNARYLKQSFGDSKPLKYKGRLYYFVILVDSIFVKMERTSAEALATKLSNDLFGNLLPKPHGKSQIFGPVTAEDFAKLDEVDWCNVGIEYFQSGNFKMAEGAYKMAIAKAKEKHVPYPAAYMWLTSTLLGAVQHIPISILERTEYIAKTKDALAAMQPLLQLGLFDAEDLQAIEALKAELLKLESEPAQKGNAPSRR